MIDILEHLQRYVPCKQVQREMSVPGSDKVVTVDDQELATTLMGGDQLTVARARGSQLIRKVFPTQETNKTAWLEYCPSVRTGMLSCA